MFNDRLTDRLIIEASQRVKEKNYWLNKLSGELVKTHFSYDFLTPAGSASAGENEPTQTTGTVTFGYEDDLFDRLMKLSNGADFRLHMILVAALAVLLHKYTGQTDITVGSPIDKQDQEVEFINTVLPLRSRVNEGTTFKSLLLQIRQTIIEAAENQNYPLEVLIDKLDVPLSDGAFPLFDTAVLLENIHDKRYLDHLRLNMIFSFLRTGHNIEGTIEYNPYLYEKATIEGIIRHLRQLFTRVLLDLDLPVFEIDILTGEERKSLLLEFNDNKTDFPRDKTVHQFIETHAKKIPHRVAIAFDGNRLTYRELNERANQLGQKLREKGIRQDKPVGILLDRSLLMVESILATWKSGGAYIPMETDYPYKRIQEILDDSRAGVLLTETRYVDTHPEQRYHGEKIMMDPWKPTAAKPGETTGDQEPVAPGCCMRDLAYIIYTSGSTGKPKGAMVEHIGMMNHIHAKINDLQLTENSIIAQNATHTFDISVWQFFAALTLGGKTIIYPHTIILEPQWLIDRLIDDGVTILEVVPSYLSVLLDFIPGNRAAVPLYLDYLVVTGEELKPHLVKRWFETFRDIKVVNAYGPTEASDDITHYILEKAPDLQRIPIGSPLQNFNIYIIDEHMKLCPIGVKGEICVSGPGVGRGYLNDMEKTRHVFLENPFPGGNRERLYRTGDVGRWLADGTIDFLGRKDHQLKIRGFRIEPGEIENIIVKHPGIKEAAVIDKKDPQGNKYLCAYIVRIGAGEGKGWSVPGPGENPNAEFREYIQKKLPDYMIPTYFVELERIPLTPNGKVDRKALPDPAGQRDSITAPATALQKEILNTWSEVLSIDKNHIGIDINFFELGGHSLKAIEMTSKLHKKLNIKLPLAEVFKAQTIRELAAYIEKAAKAETYASIEPVEKKEYYALSSAQKRMFVLKQLDPDSTAYNMPQVIPLQEEPEVERLEKTFKELINRHESLRTSFQMRDNQLDQRIHDTVEFKIKYYDKREVEVKVEAEEGVPFGQDLNALGQGEGEPAAGNRHRAAALISSFIRPFDLSRAPLLRVGLIRAHPPGQSAQQETSPNRYFLLVDIHHIISDGTSNLVLQQDFMALYQDRALPALRLQYKDFSQWQISQKENIRNQEMYWLKNFEPGIPTLNLFYDYPRPATQSFAGDSVDFEIPAAHTASLKNIVLKENITLYILLLAVFNVLFSKLSGQKDIIIGTSIEGRRHADLEKIIGMFINTLAMRNYPKGEITFKEFLTHVKERTLQAFENQDYQFEDLVDKLSLTRDPGRNPLFDVMFDLQNLIDNPAPGEPQKEEQETYSYNSRVAKFDITLAAMEVAGKIHINFNYCTRLFKPATVERMIDYIKNIITIIIKEPGIPLGQLQIIREKEKEQLLYDFNSTGTGYPGDKTIRQLFEEQAARIPASIAMLDRRQPTKKQQTVDTTAQPGTGDRDNEGNAAVTYGELNRRANQLAHLLTERGVTFETCVGLLVKPSPEMIVGTLAIWKAGGAYIPIDTTLPMEQITAILADTRSNILLTTSGGYPQLNEFYRGITSGTAVSFVIYLDAPGDMEARDRLLSTFRMSSLLTGQTSTPQPRAQWLQYDNRTLSYHQYMAEAAKLRDFLTRLELPRESIPPVGIMFDNPIYKIIALLALEALNIPFTVIPPHRVKNDRQRIIDDKGMVTILSQCSFLDELDRILWESRCLKRYILLDDYKFRESSKEADFGKIWNYIAEESSEAINDYGWTGSYTNEPFTIEEMNEYIENFKVKLHPYLEKSVRVLEIGCGHGLVLFELAPQVGYYLATDLSPVIIAKNKQRAERENLDNVELQAIAASAVSDLQENKFDLIICSSVVHYFPNSLYLEKVITDAIDLLADKGIIYLDDLLDLEKKQELIRSTQEYKKMNPDARVKVDWDGDLFVGCDFFYDLQLKYPKIVQWQSTRKIGRIKNELTQFRHDIMLTVNKKLKLQPGSLSLLKKHRYSLRDIESSAPAGTSAAAASGNRGGMDSVVPGWLKDHVADISAIQSHDSENPDQQVPLPGTGCVIYTSGAATRPKGIIVEHRSLVNHIQAAVNDLQLTPQSITAPNASYIPGIPALRCLAASAAGGKTVIYAGEPLAEPGKFISLLCKDKVSVLEMLPSSLQPILEFLAANDTPLEYLQYVLISGESPDPLPVKKWLAAYPGIKIIDAYKPDGACHSIARYILDLPPEVERGPGGKPQQHLDVYIVDEYMNLCPIGVTGELLISGASAGRGYLNTPESTIDKFVINPFAEGDNVYKTGDAARWLPDGNIEYLGRIDGRLNPRADTGPRKSETRFANGDSTYILPGNEIEENLIGICREVLGTEQIGITDNFFLVGGDSIKAIQIAARLKKFKLELRINDIFLHPVLKDLSKYVTRTDRIIPQGIVAGEVALIPIQKMFLEHSLNGKHHVNQAIMLYREEGFDENILKKVLTKIVEHHDALRMVYDFRENIGTVIQVNRGIEGKLFDFEIIDLQNTPEENIPAQAGKEADRINRQVDIKTGSLVKSAVFRTTTGDHLLIVISHLVIDGISWRILLEDLSTGYRQLQQGEEIIFPEKTDSYMTWSQKLSEYAGAADSENPGSESVFKELAYWQEVEAAEINPLPKDYHITAGKKQVKYSTTINMMLEEEETEQLLRNVNQAYNTEINDILLAALGMAFYQWAGMKKILVNLEGHGRESIIKDIDINRTVGCFTTLYPVVLDMYRAEKQGLSYVIRSVKETLRRIKNNGIGYGILKYLTPPGKRQDLCFKHKPEISFNYLGQFGQERLDNEQLGQQDNDTFIRFSPLRAGMTFSPGLEQLHTIDINGMMAGGRLGLSFTYNKYEYERERMEKLVEIYKSNLSRIIRHCISREESEPTPSDLGYTGIDIQDLDEWEDELSEIE